MMEYPKEILDLLSNASQRTGQSIETMQKFYETELDEISKLQDSQFADDLDRHRYCIQVFWVKYVSRPPVKPHRIIPIGYSKPRTLKSGSTVARMYVIDADDGKIHPIVLYDEKADIIKSITTMCLYTNVNLGEYNDGITFTADDRAVFNQPEMVEATPHELLSRYNFPVVDIKNIDSNLSRRTQTSTGSYTDELDWKVIKGTIQREIVSKAQGIKLGYNVIDFSVTGEPQRVLQDGTKRDPGITIWANEQLMTHGQFDQCEFYGPVDKATPKPDDLKDQKKALPEPAMNAFVILKPGK